MSDTDKFDKAPSPWQPMSDPVDLAVIGKTLEELAECSAALSRCLIQGIDELDPDTGRSNRDQLTDEVADVYATIGLLYEHFRFVPTSINHRVEKKRSHLRRWFEMLRDQRSGKR